MACAYGINLTIADKVDKMTNAFNKWYEALTESDRRDILRKVYDGNADAKRFDTLAQHAWEVKTYYDKDSNVRELRMVFRTSTITSESMRQSVSKLVDDFAANPNIAKLP